MQKSEKEVSAKARRKVHVFAKEDANKVFMTIRETARVSGLSEKYLRQIQKEKKLPGIYCGTRYMVNFPMLMQALSHSSLDD